VFGVSGRVLTLNAWAVFHPHISNAINTPELQVLSYSVEDGATAFLDEPHLGLFLGNLLELANTVGLRTTAGNTSTVTAEDNVEVHAENTGGGVVLDAEINVFVDTEAEIA
jgi:hypothetical protein